MDDEKPYLMRKEILDHGFVELLDVMGSDESIVNTARTSYDKGTKQVSSTKGLLRYLLRQKHMGPFEFGVCIFRIRCPFFVARQWFRHRTASYNEISLRYSEAVEEYYVPDAEMITTQDAHNRQARTGQKVSEAMNVRAQLEKDPKLLLSHYHDYLDKGVAREIARINLPLSLYTTFMFKMDIRNLMNFYSLRVDPHAQYEIRVYAKAMVKMTEKYFPVVIQAWRDYFQQSVTFSAAECEILGHILTKELDIVAAGKSFTDDHPETHHLSKGETKEFLDKLRKITGREPTMEYMGKSTAETEKH